MKTFTTYAEKKAKQIFNLLQGYTKGIRITAILILLLMGVSNAWAASTVQGGYIYFDATQSGWSVSDVQMVVGHNSYSNFYGMSNISNTSLYYLKVSGWSDATYFAFANGCSNWGGENNKYDNRKSWITGKYTAAKTNYTLNNNNSYLFYASTSSNNASITTSSPAGHLSGGYNDLNSEQIINTVVDGTVANSKATISLTSYKMTANGAVTKQEATHGTGSKDSYISAARTATTTLTVGAVATGYQFDGWYTAATGGTLLSSSTTYIYYPTSATTVYARFSEKKYTVTVKNDGHGTTTPSGAQSNVGQVTGLSIKATPAANYEFVNWTITSGSGSFGSETSASTTFKPTSAATIQANFRSTATNSLTVATGAGIASVTGSEDPVTLGNTYPITATPKTGYTFSTWTANPAANATFGNATTANTTVTVKNGSVTVTASATENMSTLTTSNQYDAGDPGYAVPTASVNSIGYETTATVTATAAGNGYTFTGWTLTNCTRTDGGAADATNITVRSNGDSKAAEVVANYAEDLTSTYYVQGDNAGPFSEGWNANQNTMMKKHSGNANSNDVYWEIDVPQSKVTPNNNQWEFKIYNDAGSDDNKKWLGWGSGGDHYWLTKENNNLTLSTSGSNNILFKPYLAGKYTFHLNYDDSSKPTLEVTWPVYNQLRISAANPADATNTGEFDMTGSGTYTVTRSLNANTTYTFKIVYDSEWYGASSGNLTRASSSKTLSTSSNNLTLKTDIAGNYTFTFNGSDKNLTVTYPEAYTVTYSRTPTAAADAPTTNPSVESGKYVAANTSVTFTAKDANNGYTWKGWYDNNAGTGTALSTNKAYTKSINTNTTIYAVYTENKYQVAIVADPAGAAATLTSSPQAVGVEAVNISTTANFTYKFDNWTATDGITIANANSESTTITATKAGTVTAHFTELQPTTVYLKPNENWKNADARFAIYYWHDGQPDGWVDMTDAGCNRDYFVATIPAGYTEFLFARMDPDKTENKWDAGIDWNQTGNLTIPADGKNLFTLPSSGDYEWNGATTTWSTYTAPTYDITINAPESGTISVTINGNTTDVTTEAVTIEDVALNTEMTVAFTGNAGYNVGKAIIQVGNNAEANAAGTYEICGPTEITAYFVTAEDQVVYLRPNDNWLADNALFYAYVFNRYGDDEWIELTTEETDYTGAYGCTIPAGYYSDVIFVRINPTATEPSWNNNVWNQSVDYVIPVNTTNNRFIIGEKVISGGDEGKYQGSWEASDTPIYGIPGDWQNEWAAGDYPLMGPDGEVTVNITQTNDTLGFKVYRYPYGTDEESRKWLGNNGTMVRGGEAVHEGGWTMETNTNNCGLAVDVAGDYVFHFNIRESKLTVQYPPMPVPSNITLSAQRVFEDAPLDWFAGNGTEANPYQLYADEAARITVSSLPEVEGLTAYYQFGNNEEQTSNVFDWKYISSQATTMEVKAYYKNAMGAKSAEATVNTSYFKTLALPFYLMTQPKDEINIDRIAAGTNITVQFRSDSKATVDLYLNDTDGTPLTTITNKDSYDFEYDVPDDIEPCILTFIAKAQGAGLHGRIFEVKADVVIYKNVIIKVNDPEGWVKNVYMWRDYSDAVLTPWPGDPVLQNYGTWRVFSVKYPYYDHFIINDGNSGGSTQTLDWELPADDTCYELLDPANNGSDKPEDKGKYGLKVADCPGNLIVSDIKDTTIMEGEQIVVMPEIFVGLGYKLSDVRITQLNANNPSSVRADISGTNIIILGYGIGESNVDVTYTLGNETITKTFTVYVVKNTNITIQVKVPDFGDGSEYQWTDGSKYGIRYWGAGIDDTDLTMDYAYTDGTFMYAQAQIPLGTDGKINFHFYYEKYGDDNAKWRQTTNVDTVRTSGCYTLKQGNDYYRYWERTADYCFDDEDYVQYQVKIFMPTLGKVYSSNIVTNTTDILSFFAPGENETGYRAGNVQLYKNKKMIASIPANNFPESNVYTATIAETGDGLDNVSTYSGNFYIRTWGTSYATVGFNNGKGWNSIKDLTAVEKDSVRFTYFISRKGEFYNHYWVQDMNTGGYDGKDVSACVANDYNDDLAGKLTKGKGTDESGDIKVGSGKVINVRFGYDPRTNYFGRAIIKGSEYNNYLNIHCDNAYKDKNCSTKLPYGTSGLENKMQDISNWVYQRDFYVPITNSYPSASLYVEATSPSTEMTVTDHLLGYVINEITGEETTTPVQRTVIGSGTNNGTYLMRVVYDFKTNRIIAAWLPQGTIEVTDDRTLNADVLFVRKENEDVPQIQLAENGKIRSLESMYFALELERGDENAANRHEEQYFFTLPFNSIVGSISGVPGYMQTWGIQRYRGDLRAQKGWFIETPTFWEWMSLTDTLYAGEGYALVFDKKAAAWNEIEVDKTDAEGNIMYETDQNGDTIYENGAPKALKETISMMRLYFPSDTSGFNMQQQSAEHLIRTYPNHPCTITRENRDQQDSNWKVIGTTSYNNAGIKEYVEDTDPEYEELNGNTPPNFRYAYEYTMSNDNKTFSYTYTPEDGKTNTYKSFFGYMVQFAGTITWQPIMSETVPEGIAARRRVAEGERTSYTTRLELANANGEKQDQAFVALDEKATTTFDQNKDLNKIINAGKANIYTLSENIPFAGNTLPMEKVTVPVGVRIATAGEYTFRMPDGTDGIAVTLVDNVTGTHTNMLMNEYTVTLNAGTIENRFYLVVDPDRTATSVENVGSGAKGDEAKGVEKFLIDGKLFIRTTDGIFDAKGQRL